MNGVCAPLVPLVSGQLYKRRPVLVAKRCVSLIGCPLRRKGGRVDEGIRTWAPSMETSSVIGCPCSEQTGFPAGQGAALSIRRGIASELLVHSPIRQPSVSPHLVTGKSPNITSSATRTTSPNFSPGAAPDEIRDRGPNLIQMP